MRRLAPLFAVAAAAAALAPASQAQFPYEAQNGGDDYSSYRLPSSRPIPNDLSGKLEWMYASTPPSQPTPLTGDKRELDGVRGSWVVDANRTAPQAWHTTTGRPDVTIAVLDSGVMWNDAGKPMNDVRTKTRINTGEAPLPQADRASSTDPVVASCGPLEAREGRRDLNDDGVFNVSDYACDSRVDPTPPKGVGLPILDPQDVLIAFTDGEDDDNNGYVDDMVGWDFLDDDNDPFDDVQYGHGSGEARDSVGEANNGGDLGPCPNCMEIHMRVGTSFVAEVNRFALATMYAVDNDVDIVQEALGTINKSRLAADAMKYAYDHGVTVIASAADEAAQHHNWPSSYPYAIVVNSATHDGSDQTSFLMFNGCTNFSSRITLAIPSVSCSSDATGRAAGMAGLVYSAALDAHEHLLDPDTPALRPHPACRRTNGARCLLTANEVRQVMATGTFGSETAADDVNFAVDPVTGTSNEPSCGGQPIPGCTDPFAPLTGSLVPRLSVPESYPARKGHDQFYGYGRVNMNRVVDQVFPGGDTTGGGDDAASRIPPEVEVTSPEWYETVDPAGSAIPVRGLIWNRGAQYKCTLYVAPGAYPMDTASTDGGDFVKITAPGNFCDGTTTHTDPLNGVVVNIPMDDVKALFNPALDFTGLEGGATGQGTPNPGNNTGRPNKEPYSFVVKVVATTVGANPALTGQDRRQAYLHRDADMLDGFPMQLPGDVEASPVLADVDGDNRNELVLANSDGLVHVWRRDGSELPGYPFHTDPAPYRTGSRAFRTGAVAPAWGAILGTPAVGDLDHDGTLEIVVADMESKVYVLDGETGELEHKMATRIEYSGRPLEPFENVRGVDASGTYVSHLGNLHRTQTGFIASPVLADVDGNDGGRLEIVAAAMDRHVYIWNDSGSDVPGWPLVVVDQSPSGKLRSTSPQIDPVTHMPFFDLTKDPGGEKHDQGPIVATPAVGDLNGDGTPEIVVGTNENYWDGEGGETVNTSDNNKAAFQPLAAAGILQFANGRLFAFKPGGDADGDPNSGPVPLLNDTWPFKPAILYAGLLPLVAEGITGSPMIGDVPCNGPTAATRVGVMPAAGIAYVVDPETAESCYGRDQNDHDIGLSVQGGTASDQPVLPAVGHPAFMQLGTGWAFVAPAAGAQRAGDVGLPEYQAGQDYLVAWELSEPAGAMKQGWPVPMNDLQFLTGPSAADISPAPGDEVIAGSAHHDLRGYTSAGVPLGTTWPKLSGDWTVSNPTLGSFGTLDTADDATMVVIAGTRNGRLNAYDTGADACASASWPRFHHDLANSGDTRRDAVNPGKPADAAIAGGALTFTSPGDDLMCGTPKSYQVRTSASAISPADFGAADAVEAKGDAKAAGAKASLALTGDLKRYVAVRAVDDQGNVGRPAVIDTSPSQGSTGAPPVMPGPGAGPPATKPGNTGGGAVKGLADKNGCLPAKLRFGRLGLGAIRLGGSDVATLRRAGFPAKHNKAGTVWTYCVRGGGKVALVFVKKKLALIATTARGHRARGVGPGSRVSKLRSLRSPRLVFRARRGKVRVLGITSVRGSKSRRALLKRAAL